LSREAAFLVNDRLCRRYPGAFRGPLDPALLALPWFVKEAVVMLEQQEHE